MVTHKSKNTNARLPDQWDFQSTFFRMEQFPNAPETKRVDVILRLLSRLSRGDADKTVLPRLRHAVNPYLWRYIVTDSNQGVVAVLRGVEGGNNWEYGAVRDALALLEHGHHWRLFECDVCGKLGFATAKKQRFCGPKCKTYDYDSKPENRVKKRENMRTNRRTLKTQGRNTQSGVGLSRRNERARSQK